MRTYFHSVGLVMAVFSFHLSYGVATALYPGGTWKGDMTVGHSFWQNYLCDVLKDPGLNGAPNPGVHYGVLAFVLLLVTLLVWWTLLARVLREHAPVFSRLLLMASLLSAIGFVGIVVFTAEEGLLTYHFAAILFSVLSGLCATITPFVCFLRIRAYRSLGIVGLLLTSTVVVNICFYVAHHLDEALHNDNVLVPLQKLSVIAISVLCLLTAYGQMKKGGAPN